MNRTQKIPKQHQSIFIFAFTIVGQGDPENLPNEMPNSPEEELPENEPDESPEIPDSNDLGPEIEIEDENGFPEIEEDSNESPTRPSDLD